MEIMMITCGKKKKKNEKKEIERLNNLPLSFSPSFFPMSLGQSQQYIPHLQSIFDSILTNHSEHKHMPLDLLTIISEYISINYIDRIMKHPSFKEKKIFLILELY